MAQLCRETAAVMQEFTRMAPLLLLACQLPCTSILSMRLLLCDLETTHRQRSAVRTTILQGLDTQ